MIIIDKALRKREKENNPIKVGMVGAGFMAKGIALQIEKFTPGMELVAISNRTSEKARTLFENVVGKKSRNCVTLSETNDSISKGLKVVTENPELICDAEEIDAVIEVTGSVDLGAMVAIRAIQNGKHIIMMNAETDGTIGPYLKHLADQYKVVFTNADGDQPGVIINLYRFVQQIGLRPVLCGNIKGLHDPYRNPTTQEGFAKKWGQNPSMVTSFADGSKISFEQGIVANATGMRVAKRGMIGPTVAAGTPIRNCLDQYPMEELLEGPGIVDYIVGADPAPGVFVLGTMDDPIQKHYLNLYKVGEGPLYCFYNPYHLCHFEVPITVARAVLFQDAAIAPKDKPYVDVVATAKKPLKKGERLDGIGEYATYGLCENSDTVRAQQLLPIGLSEGAVLNKDIPQDQVLSFNDVSLAKGKISNDIWRKQEELFYPI
jgi:predicted homoserine dehydrogenase-like protein